MSGGTPGVGGLPAPALISPGLKPVEVRKPVAPLAPNIADMALRDATSGKVRRVRGGSMRASVLGQAMEFAWVVGVVGALWLRAVLRGEVW